MRTDRDGSHERAVVGTGTYWGKKQVMTGYANAERRGKRGKGQGKHQKGGTKIEDGEAGRRMEHIQQELQKEGWSGRFYRFEQNQQRLDIVATCSATNASYLLVSCFVIECFIVVVLVFVVFFWAKLIVRNGFPACFVPLYL